MDPAPQATRPLFLVAAFFVVVGAALAALVVYALTHKPPAPPAEPAPVERSPE